jgi:threonine/homoserine/homoserine lactone efflux protein
VDPVLMTFLLIGIAAGALTGVPIGPVNVAVIDASYRHTLRRAISVGLGGACADCMYAALGVLGVTPIIGNYPSVPPVLFAVSGIVLLIYGYRTARSSAVVPVPTTPDAAEVVNARDEMKQGFRVGVALILMNPAAVVTWVVIMTTFVPTATPLEGVFCAIGVFCGSWGWFTLVAYLTHRGKHVLGDNAAWIPRVVGVALMVYAVYLLAKAVRFVAFT